MAIYLSLVEFTQVYYSQSRLDGKAVLYVKTLELL